ncbi:hypothetical protein A2V54_03325 [candidate division WWE3 bacterium RBG_19FT_COMBO_53_11]|uniref:Uncharacterized protein n=1 Tax=candidate division WWE3 bacterium RBG_19FT_COMBO_53_11 TaxID=1802613 RepID=A0A1F4UHU5_UNCKA|nr:MAG: hypothetical protein A2155_02905 [candidate division WWE3 bacterium RBG_16_52_45]OGC44380.1 MAG: hypothetical protein A2V54_03325 [candidate division WWE3 bacterium RBG_19FT_COMBO_53_11]
MAGTAPPPAERPGIELLSPTTSTGKSKLISFWARTIGIPLIIVLQLSFLGIFAFRAKLETDLRKLSASVAEKEKVVAEASDFEQTFLRTQRKLEQIRLVRKGLCVSCAIETLNRIKPPAVTLITVVFEGEKLQLIAETPQGLSFANFVANILKEEGVREALLTSGNLNRDGDFVFAMQLGLDKEKLR